jgi:hypothetical protein
MSGTIKVFVSTISSTLTSECILSARPFQTAWFIYD